MLSTYYFLNCYFFILKCFKIISNYNGLMSFRVIKVVLIHTFIIITLLTTSPELMNFHVNKTHAIPPNWIGCNLNQEGPFTVENVGPSANSITGYWEALIGMTLNEEKNFIVPSNENPYTPQQAPEISGKALYYVVTVEGISSGSVVIQGVNVDTYYELYVDCTVLSGGTTETSSTSISPTSTSPSQDNTIPILAGLGVIVIGLSVFGYFTIIKPRAELPQDTKITEEKQAKKQMNQTKELLNLIQEKKESTKTKTPEVKSSKPKSGKKPRRR
ncbi:MAG: hypothetical protein HeimC3_25620 [Candidatus Heimdallarchaeota archaeon LC_3]|nr:MAG: hypothetical protein HeimC3_25620 [Candidatus Heimdallarchaeota archaeon LC_3]